MMCFLMALQCSLYFLGIVIPFILLNKEIVSWMDFVSKKLNKPENRRINDEI